MSLPKVAIVGRPNVGKSSIFNWLARRRISIVDPTAGVTRDRVLHLLHHDDRFFELIDTGGIGVVDSDDLSEEIDAQIHTALNEASLILFVVDGITGITPLDQQVAQQLHRVGKPLLLVVNKCDSTRTQDSSAEFLELAADAPMVAISVKANRHQKELLGSIVAHLPPAEPDESEQGEQQSVDPVLRLAIVGRRNVGKSTFINQLAEEERVIVSEVAGTTRDSIDIRFEIDGHVLLAIDTPGVRKKKSLANDIEFYALVRAQRSIRRADVVLMFFDATQTISKVDKQLVEEIQQQHKPCVFVVNKWDRGLAEEMTTERWSEYLIRSFSSMRHVPIAFVTAKDGRNIHKLVNLTQHLFREAAIRVGTGRLNRIIEAAIEANPAPYRQNKRPKIYFATQVATRPPTIVLKCNHPDLFDETWKRYLLGVLREETPFQEVPIRLVFRAKGDADPHDEGLGANLTTRLAGGGEAE